MLTSKFHCPWIFNNFNKLIQSQSVFSEFITWTEWRFNIELLYWGRHQNIYNICFLHLPIYKIIGCRMFYAHRNQKCKGNNCWLERSVIRTRWGWGPASCVAPSQCMKSSLSWWCQWTFHLAHAITTALHLPNQSVCWCHLKYRI